jgi:hypothetical protein
MVLGNTDVQAEDADKGAQIENPVDHLNSAYAHFSSSPSEIVFGQWGEELCRVAPQQLQPT